MSPRCSGIPLGLFVALPASSNPAYARPGGACFAVVVHEIKHDGDRFICRDAESANAFAWRDRITREDRMVISS
jgi:hypothetical protein